MPIVALGVPGWLQRHDAQKMPWMCGLGVPVGCRMKNAKGLFKRPIRSHGCVALGCLLAAQMKHANVWPWGACWLQDEACQFKGLERLEGFRAGKRQAWTPRRSHGCVALGCLLAAG